MICENSLYPVDSVHILFFLFQIYVYNGIYLLTRIALLIRGCQMEPLVISIVILIIRLGSRDHF